MMANITSPNMSLTSTTSSGLGTGNIIGITILVVAFVFGFPGNLFVVWTIIFRITRRSVTCLMVLNLSIADALLLLTAPLFLRFLAAGTWEFGPVVCKLIHYLGCVNMYASIFLICIMSLDRYVAVNWPLISQQLRTKKSMMKILLGLWSLAFLFAIPMLFYRKDLQPYLHKGLTIYICMPYHPSSNHKIFQYLMESISAFFLPFILIVFCYTNVGRKLQDARFKKKQRTSRLILIIVVAFTVFWLPYHIVNMMQVSGILNNSTRILKAAETMKPNVTAFAFLSSSINPILYVFAGSSFIRSAGVNFMAKLFVASNSDGSSRGFSRATKISRNDSVEMTKIPDTNSIKDKTCGKPMLS
ncbi:leukotriene B4 receptor 1-like isoform X2 [Polypterus senegalus]|nr:leukotriene B4 receptor 1-like isoform X2 [Polypterus senegalus]